MSARLPTTTADVVPQYGMRPVGGWGIRGWRVHCPECGHLSDLHLNIRGAQHGAHRHRCQLELFAGRVGYLVG